MDDSTQSALILTVDVNKRNLALLTQVLHQAGYRTLSAATIAALDQALEEPISLALIDVSGFGADIWQRCQRFHERAIPLLVISARQSAALQQASIAYGARGVLVKPVIIRELLGLIRSLLQ
ncbi:response regulator [Roseiflexus castenholzii]|jgi:DNA-binding response OmpR family regulator|uniref:Response regulator receiver protein n=1 Tax=Roseiflexus castenholzii (strain DSM 13941 / HLO8) TaxID=383372 RepID=A7NH47_ROSCS|nr:response regulator [Roseiflexus castenholzii]ABU56794.1 response regulator receiver protein [Roseiflexus castenholzii DSM 13941]